MLPSGERMELTTVAGRTTAFVPAVQRREPAGGAQKTAAGRKQQVGSARGSTLLAKAAEAAHSGVKDCRGGRRCAWLIGELDLQPKAKKKIQKKLPAKKEAAKKLPTRKEPAKKESVKMASKQVAVKKRPAKPELAKTKNAVKKERTVVAETLPAQKRLTSDAQSFEVAMSEFDDAAAAYDTALAAVAAGGGGGGGGGGRRRSSRRGMPGGQ